VRYACDEAADKKKETWNRDDWKTFAPKDIPAQTNGCDCGVFMLKYADWLALEAPLSFVQADMPYFRRRIVAECCQKRVA